MNSVFDRFVKKYDAWYDKNKFAYLSELEALRKILPNKGKGLEIGVGTGRFAVPLGIKFGVDPSKRMLEFAKARGIKVELGSGEDLSFNRASFDYVVIIITLCFVKDPLKVLKETKRVLRKNGKLIIGIIDKDSFLGEFYHTKQNIFYRQAHLCSVKELASLLRQVGFEKISYFQTLFSLPGNITSIEKPQKGFGKGGFVVIVAQ